MNHCLRFGLVGLLLGGGLQAQAPVDRMIKVGEESLHVMELGSGPVTVLFEAGFSMDLSAWRRVAPEVAKGAKVAVYSRVGTGKSSIPKNPPTLESHVGRLEGLLKEGGLKPPFVLVSHSYGAHILRAFAARHPGDVAGMVFVDPAIEGFYPELKRQDAARFQADEATNISRMPPVFRAEYSYVVDLMLKGQKPESAPLPNVPTALLTSVKSPAQGAWLFETPENKALWRKLHTDFFAQFSQGLQVVTPHAGHNIQLEDPALVVEAIQHVLGKVEKEAKRKVYAQAMEAATRTLDEAAALLGKAQTKEAEALVASRFDGRGLGEVDLNNLGYACLGKRRQPELGELILRRITQLFPQSPNAWDSHGEALMALKRPGEARAAFQQALKLAEASSFPGVPGIRKNLEAAEKALAP